MRLCTVDGCHLAHRAKGYCAKHYRQQFGRGEKRRIVQCVVCGTLVERHNAGPKRRATQFPTCGNECRRDLTFGISEPLPEDHWARRFGSRSALAYSHCHECDCLIAHESNHERRYCRRHQRRKTAHAARFVSAECNDCGSPVMLDRHQSQNDAGTGVIYCTPQCRDRSARRRRRAREHGAPGDFRWVDVIRLFLLGDKRCAYCDQHVKGQPDPDHVVPLSRGGSNDISNILPSCRACNTEKNDLTLGEWERFRQDRDRPPRRYAFDGTVPRFRHLQLREASGSAYRDRVAA